jgi:hypothetical protein
MPVKERTMFKLLLTWNIRPGYEAEYSEFVRLELGPGMVELGIRPTDSWLTYYGDYPQILTGGISRDLGTLQSALTSGKWRDLKSKLLTLVTDYEQRIVRADGTLQL